jgi:hypothetical protein
VDSEAIPDHLQPGRTVKFCCYLAWLAAFFLALFVITLGFVASGIAATLSVVCGLGLLIEVFVWQYRCRPGLCASVSPFLVGLVVGAAIIGLMMLSGLTTTSTATLLGVSNRHGLRRADSTCQGVSALLQEQLSAPTNVARNHDPVGIIISRT